MQTPISQKQVTLSGGMTVAIQPFLFKDAVALSGDLIALVEDMAARVQGKGAPLLSTEVFKVYRRVVQHSLVRPEEVDDLQLADLAELIDAVWEINRLPDLLKKQMARDLQRQELRAELLTSS